MFQADEKTKGCNMGLRQHDDHSKKIRNTKRWTALRLVALRRDNYKCVQCEARGPLEVDHIKRVKDYPDLAYELDNLQCLCKVCHSDKTRVEVGHKPISANRSQWRTFVKSQTVTKELHNVGVNQDNSPPVGN